MTRGPPSFSSQRKGFLFHVWFSTSELAPLFGKLSASHTSSASFLARCQASFTTCCGSPHPPLSSHLRSGGRGRNPGRMEGEPVAARSCGFPAVPRPPPPRNSASHFLGMFRRQPESVIAAASLGHLCRALLKVRGPELGGGGGPEGGVGGAHLAPSSGPARPAGARDPLRPCPLPPAFRLPAGTRHCTARPWRTADPSQRRATATRPPAPALLTLLCRKPKSPRAKQTPTPRARREAAAPRLCFVRGSPASGRVASAVRRRGADAGSGARGGEGTVLGGRGAEHGPGEPRSRPGGRCPPLQC